MYIYKISCMAHLIKASDTKVLVHAIQEQYNRYYNNIYK